MIEKSRANKAVLAKMAQQAIQAQLRSITKLGFRLNEHGVWLEGQTVAAPELVTALANAEKALQSAWDECRKVLASGLQELSPLD